LHTDKYSASADILYKSNNKCDFWLLLNSQFFHSYSGSASVPDVNNREVRTESAEGQRSRLHSHQQDNVDRGTVQPLSRLGHFLIFCTNLYNSAATTVQPVNGNFASFASVENFLWTLKFRAAYKMNWGGGAYQKLPVVLGCLLCTMHMLCLALKIELL